MRLPFGLTLPEKCRMDGEGFPTPTAPELDSPQEILGDLRRLLVKWHARPVGTTGLNPVWDSLLAGIVERGARSGLRITSVDRGYVTVEISC